MRKGVFVSLQLGFDAPLVCLDQATQDLVSADGQIVVVDRPQGLQVSLDSQVDLSTESLLGVASLVAVQEQKLNVVQLVASLFLKLALLLELAVLREKEVVFDPEVDELSLEGVALLLDGGEVFGEGVVLGDEGVEFDLPILARDGRSGLVAVEDKGGGGASSFSSKVERVLGWCRHLLC